MNGTENAQTIAIFIKTCLVSAFNIKLITHSDKLKSKYLTTKALGPLTSSTFTVIY